MRHPAAPGRTRNEGPRDIPHPGPKVHHRNLLPAGWAHPASQGVDDGRARASGRIEFHQETELVPQPGWIGMRLVHEFMARVPLRVGDGLHAPARYPRALQSDSASCR